MLILLGLENVIKNINDHMWLVAIKRNSTITNKKKLIKIRQP